MDIKIAISHITDHDFLKKMVIRLMIILQLTIML